jgi:hypothetical protein
MTSWWLIYQAKVSRLDEAMKSQLLRAGRPRMRSWQFDKVLLPRIFGTDADTLIALLVSDSNGNTLYQSDNWPSDLEVNNLGDRVLNPYLHLTDPYP